MKGFLVTANTDVGYIPLRVLHDPHEAEAFAADVRGQEIIDAADGLNLDDPEEFYEVAVIAFVGGLPVEVVATVALDSPCVNAGGEDMEDDVDFDSDLE